MLRALLCVHHRGAAHVTRRRMSVSRTRDSSRPLALVRPSTGHDSAASRIAVAFKHSSAPSWWVPDNPCEKSVQQPSKIGAGLYKQPPGTTRKRGVIRRSRSPPSTYVMIGMLGTASIRPLIFVQG